MAAHIPEVHISQLPQCTDNLSSNLVRDVELRQTHLRRAEEGIFLRHPGGGPEGCTSRGDKQQVRIVMKVSASRARCEMSRLDIHQES